ncbi:MAG: hypothetical protein ACPGJS_02465 [Flammeovirgaceae bacterium]
MKTIIFTCLSLFICLQVQAVKITLAEAIKKRQVQVIAQGNGGYSGKALKISTTNRTNSKLEIEVEAGTIFQSADEAEQDLMVTKEELFVLQPRGKSIFHLFTMCIQSHNMSPARQALFTFNRMAQGDLLKLVQLINENNYQHSTAQSAVWAITDGGSIDEIYGSDTAMVRKLASVVGPARNIPTHRFNYTPRVHQITTIKTSIECLVPDYLEGVALRAYEKESGRLVRELFKDKSFKPGFYQFKGGINHTLGDSAQFILRLEQGDQIISEKTATLQDTVPKLQKMPETFVSFDLPKETTIRGGIYDSDDKLYVLLADKKKLFAGFNRIDFIKSRDLPQNKEYFFKVKDMEGNTIVKQTFHLDQATRKNFKTITKRGTYRFRMDRGMIDLKLAIYDQHDRIVWVVFNNSRLTKGAKSIPYVFQHRQGPDAPFKIKLTGKDGKVIREKCIVNCR